MAVQQRNDRNGNQHYYQMDMRADFTDDDFDDEYAEEALFENEPDLYPGRRQQGRAEYGADPH